MKKEVTDIVFLLDRSGSMSGLENDTIKSYNNYLERMKSQNVRVTTVLFDDKYEFVTEQTNIKNVKKDGQKNILYKREYCTIRRDWKDYKIFRLYKSKKSFIYYNNRWI